MSRFKEHLTLDELMALSDGTFELLPETFEHIEKCDECSSMVKKYESMKDLISANRHISHFPDLEKIMAISEASFKLLHEDVELTENEKEKSSFVTLLLSFLKPAALVAGTALFTLLIYTGIEKDSNDEKLASTETDSAQETDVPGTEEVITELASSEPSQREKGTVINTRRAKIETLAASFIGFASENEVVMKKGKAKFDIVNGEDFTVNVNDRLTVRVLGTSFVIESDGKRFSVHVLEGLVEVIDRSDNSVSALSADMNKIYESTKISPAIKIEKTASVKQTPRQFSDNKLIVTPDASFLTQGREALGAGKKGAALQLFIMELERGNEKDKALFEITRIHSNEGRNNEVANILRSNSSILNSSKLYKEELLIRGCHSQHREGSNDRSFCHQYLKEFPRGYKRNEIQELVNGK